ncbi:unnamed protein product, partial [marine sediment metagenome]
MGNILSKSGLDQAATTVNTLGTTQFPDNVLASFGSGQDMDIFHSGGHGYIRNCTGDLFIRTNESENAIQIKPNSCVQLSYDGVAKFKTITNGACTTGTHYATTFNGCATNSALLDSLDSTAFVRKDIITQSSAFPSNCLIFQYTDSSNIDYICNDDGTNSYHFVHDSAAV